MGYVLTKKIFMEFPRRLPGHPNFSIRDIYIYIEFEQKLLYNLSRILFIQSVNSIRDIRYISRILKAVYSGIYF